MSSRQPRRYIGRFVPDEPPPEPVPTPPVARPANTQSAGSGLKEFLKAYTESQKATKPPAPAAPSPLTGKSISKTAFEKLIESAARERMYRDAEKWTQAFHRAWENSADPPYVPPYPPVKPAPAVDAAKPDAEVSVPSFYFDHSGLVWSFGPRAFDTYGVSITTPTSPRLGRIVIDRIEGPTYDIHAVVSVLRVNDAFDNHSFSFNAQGYDLVCRGVKLTGFRRVVEELEPGRSALLNATFCCGNTASV